MSDNVMDLMNGDMQQSQLYFQDLFLIEQKIIKILIDNDFISIGQVKFSEEENNYLQLSLLKYSFTFGFDELLSTFPYSFICFIKNTAYTLRREEEFWISIFSAFHLENVTDEAILKIKDTFSGIIAKHDKLLQPSDNLDFFSLLLSHALINSDSIENFLEIKEFLNSSPENNKQELIQELSERAKIENLGINSDAIDISLLFQLSLITLFDEDEKCKINAKRTLREFLNNVPSKIPDSLKHGIIQIINEEDNTIDWKQITIKLDSAENFLGHLKENSGTIINYQEKVNNSIRQLSREINSETAFFKNRIEDIPNYFSEEINKIQDKQEQINNSIVDIHKKLDNSSILLKEQINEATNHLNSLEESQFIPTIFKLWENINSLQKSLDDSLKELSDFIDTKNKLIRDEICSLIQEKDNLIYQKLVEANQEISQKTLQDQNLVIEKISQLNEVFKGETTSILTLIQNTNKNEIANSEAIMDLGSEMTGQSGRLTNLLEITDKNHLNLISSITNNNQVLEQKFEEISKQIDGIQGLLTKKLETMNSSLINKTLDIHNMIESGNVQQKMSSDSITDIKTRIIAQSEKLTKLVENNEQNNITEISTIKDINKKIDENFYLNKKTNEEIKKSLESVNISVKPLNSIFDDKYKEIGGKISEISSKVRNIEKKTDIINKKIPNPKPPLISFRDKIDEDGKKTTYIIINLRRKRE